MKPVLITGVTGFVGTNLVQYLTSGNDFVVYGHSRKPEPGVKFDQRINFLPDYSFHRLTELKIGAFIHLAGIAHDLSNQYTSEDYDRVNFTGTKNAVDLFLKSDARKFIFISSIKALCDTASIPAIEEMKPYPQTEYGKSKLKAEEYIRSVASDSDKQFYILRPAMMHGPGNKGNLNLMYRFVKGGLPFPFGSFNNHRSFHSIENFNFVIQAILEREIAPGTYHLADDGFLSTTDLYKLIGEAIRRKTLVLNLPKWLVNLMAKSAGKIDLVRKLTEDMVVSNKKIKKEIGVPLPVSLEEGLLRTIRSFDGL